MKNTENTDQENTRKEKKAKRPYEQPTLKEWGTVADLTNTGAGTGGDPLGGSLGCAG